MQKLKICLIGLKGFIGSHFADHYINEGHEVIGIDNESTGNYINEKVQSYYKWDITTTNLSDVLFDCDIIIHFASIARVQPSFDDPIKYIHNNVIGVTNCLEALKGWKGKFIYFSSSSVYNGTFDKFGSKETDKLNPMSPYALSKVMAEDVCTFYRNHYQLDIKIVRPFNVYGDRMSTQSGYATAIQVFLDNYKNNEPMIVYGDGSQRRDFTHINDVISATNLIINSETDDYIFNLASGKNCSINLITSLFSDKTEIEYRPAVKEPMNTLGNIDLLKSIGYKPTGNLIQFILDKIANEN